MYDFKEDFLALAVRVNPQWLAGFFDGEGCVHARIRQHGTPPSVIVTLSQKDLRPLSLVLLKFPQANGPRFYHGTGSAYLIEYSGKNCIDFLESIKDHVVVKKTQVEAGLELARLIEAHGQDVSEAKTARRWELAKIIKEANGAKHAFAER